MKIVIIGGVAAGAKAAAKIKRLLPDAVVEIYTDDTHVSYSSCGLPYYIEGNFTDYRSLLVRSVDEFKAAGINVFIQTKVDKILPKQRQILVSTDNEARLVKYDKLIIATGARPKIPNIKGVNDFENIYTLRRVEDGIKIREKMLQSSHVTIIGSGFIGLEMLEAFVKNGLKVDVIEHNQHIMKSFDPDMSELLRTRLESSSEGKYRFHTSESVVEFIGTNKDANIVRTQSGLEIKTDMILLSTGIIPNSELASDAGIEIGSTGAIKVNKIMETSIDDIYACGDCCEETHIVSGHPVWIPLGSTANKEGKCAALNAAGHYNVFEGVLGSVVSRCFDTTIAMTGLSENGAISAGFSPISVIVSKEDKVAYMPNVGDITLKIIADKVTGLLLGAQAIGSVGADKRINSIATALLAHMTVANFKNNDLTYSPPYSTTIDPLLDAMTLLCKKLSDHCD